MNLGSILIVIGVASTAVQAQTLLLNNTTGAPHTGQFETSSLTVAQSFLTTESAVITSVSLDLANPSGTGTLTVSLWDSASSVPNSQIAVLGTIPDASISGAYETKTLSGLHVSLTPNTLYYVVASNSSGAVLWGSDGSVLPGSIGFALYSGGSWSGPLTSSTAALTVSSVPEPQAFVGVAGLGLLAFAAWRHGWRTVRRNS